MGQPFFIKKSWDESKKYFCLSFLFNLISHVHGTNDLAAMPIRGYF